MILYGIDVPNEIECLPSTMYVESLEHGERVTAWGFEIPEEKMDYLGEFIRPRWAKVVWKASNIKNIDIGDWVLIAYGKWSSSIAINKDGEQKDVWFVPAKTYKEGVMAISKEMPDTVKLYKKV